MNKYMQMIFIDTWSMEFRLDMLDGPSSMIMPGEQATVRLTLLSEMPLMDGQNFTMRENKITVGTGRIIKLYDPIDIPIKTKLHKQVIKIEK